MCGLFLLTFWNAALPKDNGQWEHVDPAVREWFRSLRNSNGTLCCDEADGHILGDGDWKIDDFGKYQVRFDGRWFEVPPQAVLTGHNRMGGAIVWIMNGHILCFFPGAMI